MGVGVGVDVGVGVSIGPGIGNNVGALAPVSAARASMSASSLAWALTVYAVGVGIRCVRHDTGNAAEYAACGGVCGDQASTR